MRTKRIPVFLVPIILLITFFLGFNSCNRNRNGRNEGNNIRIRDMEGNLYHVMTIGAQQWMLENLDVSKFRNGDLIPEAEEDS